MRIDERIRERIEFVRIVVFAMRVVDDIIFVISVFCGWKMTNFPRVRRF